MKKLRGICAALCTPFTEEGEKVDERALRNHIDSMLEAGVHIILVCGGTGEYAYLRPEEKRRIAEIASKHIDGRTHFMVQTSAINTADAIEFAKHAEGVGADCLLILPPYFEGPNSDGVYYHYEKISKAIKIPIMV
jgi:4-hydroxy-tetrahydrodipicolinate synthase